MTTAPWRVRRRVTGLAYATGLLAGLASGSLGPFLPAIARTQQIALDRAGLIVSGVFVGFLLAVLVGSRVIDRWGGRMTLTLTTALMSLGLIGLATLPGLPALLGSAVVLGLGHGFLDIGGHVVIATFNRHRLAAALNYFNVFFGIGALAGPLTAGLALGWGLPYGAALGLGAGLLAILALAFASTPLRLEHVASVGDAADDPAFLTRPLLWVLGAILCCYIGIEAAVGAWLATYLHGVDRLDENVAAAGAALFWGGLVGGRLLGGRLAARVAAPTLSIGAAGLVTVGLAMLGLLPGPPALHLVAAGAIGLGAGPIYPNTLAIGAALFPHRVSSMATVTITVGSVGGIMGPWLAGRTLVLSGPPAAMSAIGALALLLVGLCLLAGRLDTGAARRATEQVEAGPTTP